MAILVFIFGASLAWLRFKEPDVPAKPPTAGLVSTGHVERVTLQNGGFEEGLTGWKSFTTQGRKMSIGMSLPQGAKGKSAIIQINEPRRNNEYATIGQKVEGLKPDATYLFRVWLKMSTPKKSHIFICQDPNWDNRLFCTPTVNLDGWNQFSLPVKSDAEGVIGIRIVAEDAGEYWIDDVTLEEGK